MAYPHLLCHILSAIKNSMTTCNKMVIRLFCFVNIFLPQLYRHLLCLSTSIWVQVLISVLYPLHKDWPQNFPEGFKGKFMSPCNAIPSFPFHDIRSCILSKDTDLFRYVLQTRICKMLANDLCKVHLYMKTSHENYNVLTLFWFVPLKHFSFAIKLFIKCDYGVLLIELCDHAITVL